MGSQRRKAKYPPCTRHMLEFVEITTLPTVLGDAEVIGKLCTACGSRKLDRRWLSGKPPEGPPPPPPDYYDTVGREVVGRYLDVGIARAYGNLAGS